MFNVVVAMDSSQPLCLGEYGYITPKYRQPQLSPPSYHTNQLIVGFNATETLLGLPTLSSLPPPPSLSHNAFRFSGVAGSLAFCVTRYYAIIGRATGSVEKDTLCIDPSGPIVCIGKGKAAIQPPKSVVFENVTTMDVYLLCWWCRVMSAIACCTGYGCMSLTGRSTTSPDVDVKDFMEHYESWYRSKWMLQAYARKKARKEAGREAPRQDQSIHIHDDSDATESDSDDEGGGGSYQPIAAKLPVVQPVPAKLLKDCILEAKPDMALARPVSVSHAQSVVVKPVIDAPPAAVAHAPPAPAARDQPTPAARDQPAPVAPQAPPAVMKPALLAQLPAPVAQPAVSNSNDCLQIMFALCCGEGNLERAQALWTIGSDIINPDFEYNGVKKYALVHAAHNGHAHVLKWLFSNKNFLDVDSVDDILVFILAKARQPGFSKELDAVMDVLLDTYEMNDTFEQMNELFATTCRAVDASMPKRLFDYIMSKPDLAALLDTHDNSELAFRSACRFGRLDTAQWLLTLTPTCPVDVHAVDYEDCGAFWEACIGGHFHVATWLYSLCQTELLQAGPRTPLPISALQRLTDKVREKGLTHTAVLHFLEFILLVSV